MCTIVAFVKVFEDIFDTFHSAANFYIHMAVVFHGEDCKEPPKSHEPSDDVAAHDVVLVVGTLGIHSPHTELHVRVVLESSSYTHHFACKHSVDQGHHMVHGSCVS